MGANTENNGDEARSFTAGRDIKGPSVSGDRNTFNYGTGGQNRPINVGPDEDYNGTVRISKFLSKLLGKWYFPVFKGTSGVSAIGVLITVAGMFNFGQGIGSMTLITNAIQYLVPFFGCLMVLGFALSMVTAPRDSTCPKCKEPFSWFEVSRHWLGKAEVEDGRIVHNYRVTMQCTNSKCRYKRVYEDRKVETAN